MYKFIEQFDELKIGSEVYFVDHTNALDSYSNEKIRFVIEGYDDNCLVGVAYPLILVKDPTNKALTHIVEGEPKHFQLPYLDIGRYVFFSRKPIIGSDFEEKYKSIQEELEYGFSTKTSQNHFNEINKSFLPTESISLDKFQSILKDYNDETKQYQ